MIDLGRPFSKDFQDLVQSITESLQLGVEQPAGQEILYRTGTMAYPLTNAAGPVSGLAQQITGFVARKPAIFDLGKHYTYATGQLIWQPLPSIVDPDEAANWFPDDNSRLTVGYFFRDLPSGITDYNAGSVAGTLVRAISREFKLLYAQMDEAYRRAFIDCAQGVALDYVVALLAVSRHQAQPAQGEVTFWLKKAPKNDVPIPTGTRVADVRGRIFKVKAPGLIKATLEETVAVAGKVLHTSVPIGGSVHVRLQGGTKDLELESFSSDDKQGTVTLKAVPSSSSLVVTYQPKTPRITVPVIAVEPGPEGNLGSGSLTVMPTPPRGVDGGVTNEKPLTGGEAAEADDQLRERAKHALELAGNATINAIRFAVLSIDGVHSVDVQDFSTDETIPLGEVWVRFSGGIPGLMDTVTNVVEKTRAAGIRARVSQVTSVLLSGTFYVMPDINSSGQAAYALYKEKVVAALSALGIGEPVSLRKLTSLVFGVAGLADVAEIRLSYLDGDPPPKPLTSDTLLLDAQKQARPDEAAIQVVPVQTLSASNATLAPNKTLTVTLKALDDKGNPITFGNVKLDLLASVRAKPSATPNQPLQQVAQVAGTVTFTNTDHATPVFPKLDIPNLAALDKNSIEISIQTATYAGVAPGATPLTIGT